MQKRDKYWDYLKGLAILLVLTGHSIQYGQGFDYLKNQIYFDNPIFKVIYGFHMPLFMFVSGYFFFHSVCKRSLNEILLNSLKTLYVPILSFSFLRQLLVDVDLSLHGVILYFAKSIYGSTHTLWFLMAVILAQLSVGIINKYFKDHWSIYFLFTLALYILPDFWLANAKFVYPFFLLGYFVRKYDLINETNRNILFVSVASIIVYGIMITFLFNRDTYVYVTKISILTTNDIPYQAYCDTLRLVVGFFGVLGVTGVTRWLYSLTQKSIFNTLLQRLGVMTMGIYCFQDLLNTAYVKIAYFTVENAFLYFIILIITSILLVSLSSLTRTSKLLFLGGR